MEQQVNLDLQKYNEFLRVLAILRDSCNDVDMQNGIVRQRSTNASTIFEVDLTSIISDLSFPISDLKAKMDIFKIFIGNDTISISTDTEKGIFVFSDSNSMIEVKHPRRDHLDNHFINTDELSQLISINEDELLINVDISQIISSRIKTITSNFHVNNVQINFKGEEASITSTSQSKDNYAEFVKNIITNKQISEVVSSLVVTPFVIDHDGEISFRMYESTNNNVINVFSTFVDDLNFKLYTRSKLSNEEVGG